MQLDTSAVVRVFATTQDWDYDSPWQAEGPQSGTGSGVVVGPNRILTGAHVVANATFVQVQKVQDPDKVIAKVAAVWHDCDLALLEVEDERFTQGIEIPEIGGLPELRDHVSVVGFPVGGEEISITEGVVSRIEIQEYSHSQRGVLAVTIDAAINDGNSGGPVYLGEKVTGIAFQTLHDAENIGEVVPAPILSRFLSAVEEGKPAGIPGLGVRTQSLENPHQRASLNLGERSGVLVVSVQYGSSAWGVLEPRDALLELDGLPIANNGTVRYRERFRTQFDVILGDHALGETVKLKVWRKGAELELDMPLKPFTLLVPHSEYDDRPRYYVFGGLVFQPLSRNFLESWNRWRQKAPKEFLHEYYSGNRSEERREVVVLAKVLADGVNVGYESNYNQVVQRVNGVPVRDLRDLVARIEGTDGAVELETTRGLIVLDTEAVREATPEILERYRVTEDRYLGTPRPEAE